MTDQIRLGSPERRAEVVAGIRALADLLEQDSTLPLPQSVSAQFSLLGERITDAGRQLVRDTAAHLSIGLNEEPHRISATKILAHGYRAEDGSFHVWYVLHGSEKSAEGGEQE
jgi:hypothetical protein